MKVITEHTKLPPCVATIGFFDGVHQGHRFLLEQVKQVAGEQGICSSVITFPIHPRKVLHPEYAPSLLSSLHEKLYLLEHTGIEYCVLMPFTHTLSQLKAKAFMQYLRNEYNVRILVIGYDHRFGHNRTETFEDYQCYGEELDIHIIQAHAYTHGEDYVSSSAIRKALQRGDVVEAASFLGYPYSLTGIVTDGYKVGRKIGFPTANLSVDYPDKLIPKEGVYAVTVYVKEQKYLGMLNIGHRPTLNNGSDISIEVHIMDFSKDIYYEPIRIEFLQFVRPEIKFPTIDELVMQIRKDIEVVKQCKLF